MRQVPELLQFSLFHHPEGFLTFEVKYLCYGKASLLFYRLVRVYKGQARQARDLPGNTRFAGAHEADEGDVPVRSPSFLNQGLTHLLCRCVLFGEKGECRESLVQEPEAAVDDPAARMRCVLKQCSGTRVNGVKDE